MSGMRPSRLATAGGVRHVVAAVLPCVMVAVVGMAPLLSARPSIPYGGASAARSGSHSIFGQWAGSDGASPALVKETRDVSTLYSRPDTGNKALPNESGAAPTLRLPASTSDPAPVVGSFTRPPFCPLRLGGSDSEDDLAHALLQR
jgi:hypothetical protein